MRSNMTAAMELFETVWRRSRSRQAGDHAKSWCTYRNGSTLCLSRIVRSSPGPCVRRQMQLCLGSCASLMEYAQSSQTVRSRNSVSLPLAQEFSRKFHRTRPTFMIFCAQSPNPSLQPACGLRTRLISNVRLLDGWEEEGRRPVLCLGLLRVPVQSSLLVSPGKILPMAESLHREPWPL